MQLKVLHIEDNLSDAELIKIELENAYPKLELYQTYNKTEFIQHLTSKQYDVIISDYNLPDMNGLEIYELAIKYAYNTPFIFVSGTIGEERAVEVLRSGVTDYVLKENLGKLPLAINRALNEVKQTKEKQIAEVALLQSENFKTAILDSLSTHVAVLNVGGRVIGVNKAWTNFSVEHQLDISNLETINYFVYLSQFLTKNTSKIIYNGIMDVIQKKINYFYYDFSIKNNKGDKNWYTLRANTLSPDNGAVISHTNITDRKRAEQKVKLSEERYRSLIENSAEITCVIDKEGVIEYISPSIKYLLGYEEEELLGNVFFDYCHPDDKEEAMKTFQTRYEKRYGVIRYNVYRFVTNYKKYKHLRLMINDHTQTPSIKGFIINAQDITELVESEKTNHFAIIKTEENERQRISNDLHDGLGQTIAAANMCINTLESLAKEQLDERSYSIFETGKNLINNAAKETRLVSHNIMPRSLKEFGLYSSISSILKNYQGFYEEISFQINSNIENVRFKEEIELSLFRIGQESINNSIKHSKADKISVTLNKIDDNFIMEIIDNGIGFDSKKFYKNGIGIMSINQRVQGLGGKVDFKSSESDGTLISVRLDSIETVDD